MAGKPEIPDRRCTIYDVARAAGVSHMTVSRVLRQSGIVKAETVTRVQDAVRALKYRSDPALSALAAYRTKRRSARGSSNLAFLDRDGTEYSALVFEGLREEAHRQGYAVERHSLTQDARKQSQLSRMFYHRGVRGLLFGPSFEEWTFAKWQWDEFAMVSLGALTHNPRMHSVCMSYFEAASSATSRLKREGCRRIGFAVDPQLEKRTGHRWHGGYVAALETLKPYFYEGAWPIAPNEFKDWRRRKRLDGLLTLHPDLIPHWPGNVRHFVLLNSMSRQSHTGVRRIHLDPRLIGVEGLHCVHQLLLRREYGLPASPKVTGLQGDWVEGEGL